MHYDEKYKEEISRMEWEGGLIASQPEPQISVFRILINKIQSWINQTKF